MNTCFDIMNSLGKKKTPFLFIIDFDLRQPIIIPLAKIDNSEISFSINGMQNFEYKNKNFIQFTFDKHPVPYERYKAAFDRVAMHQRQGDSYLLNLTFPTHVRTNLGLKEIFDRSTAQYRLYVKDRFVVFSPETFVRIQKGKISTFPMKGTIDARIPCAETILMNDEKEFAEHVTIVDLMRNDLNMVSRNVTVEKFRYIEKIPTHEGELLQTSSIITGTLDAEYHGQIGSIFSALLPAGSITGAPKKKTVEIIKEAEEYDRGYYTGVFGIFDGDAVESAVMIRFIEQTGEGLFYKSGGGITVYSDPKSEYKELVDKVYVPIN